MRLNLVERDAGESQFAGFDVDRSQLSGRTQAIALEVNDGRWVAALAMPVPGDDPLSDADGKRILSVIEKFRWKNPASALLLAGWVASR